MSNHQTVDVSIASLSARRAWIEIKVRCFLCLRLMSLSARRAWIEMSVGLSYFYIIKVALRKESVDRNTQRRDFKRLGLLSLSARRAWIEIASTLLVYLALIRSLSARRAWIEMALIRYLINTYHRRSPQGERG